MKRLTLLLFTGVLAACTDVPPESVSPIAEACQKYGMAVSVNQYQIACFRKEK